MRAAPAIHRPLSDSGPRESASDLAQLIARVADAIGQPPIVAGDGWSFACADAAPSALDTDVGFAFDGYPELDLRVRFDGRRAIVEPGSGESTDTIAGSIDAFVDFFANRTSSQALFLEGAWRIGPGGGRGPADVDEIREHVRQLETLLPPPYQLTSDLRDRVHANAARAGCDVASRRDMAPDDVIARFVRAGTPVVLRGAIAESAWWSFDRLREIFAGAWTHLSRYPNCSYSIDACLERIVSGDPTAFKAALPVVTPLRALYSVDAYVAAAAVFTKAQALLVAPADRSMPPTYRATVWHRDWADNLLAELAGVKRVRIVSPRFADRFGLTTTAATHYNVAVDHSALDTRHPIERDGVAVSTVTLEPGDLLFLPCGWLHTVENLTPTAAINCWRVRPPALLDADA